MENKENNNIVFLLGLAGSGKDSVGEIFIKKGYKRIALADAVKKEYAQINNISIQDLILQGERKEYHRSAIIKFAEAKRAIEPEYWIKLALNPYMENGLFKPNINLVITDFRRISEIKWYISLFKTVSFLNYDPRIQCISNLKMFCIKRDIEDSDILSHYAIGYAQGYSDAENGFPIIDAIIDNNSDLPSLENKIENCIKYYNL
jgi:hypothetical protein